MKSILKMKPVALLSGLAFLCLFSGEIMAQETESSTTTSSSYSNSTTRSKTSSSSTSVSVNEDDGDYSVRSRFSEDISGKIKQVLEDKFGKSMDTSSNEVYRMKGMGYEVTLKKNRFTAYLDKNDLSVKRYQKLKKNLEEVIQLISPSRPERPRTP